DRRHPRRRPCRAAAEPLPARSGRRPRAAAAAADRRLHRRPGRGAAGAGDPLQPERRHRRRPEPRLRRSPQLRGRHRQRDVPAGVAEHVRLHPRIPGRGSRPGEHPGSCPLGRFQGQAARPLPRPPAVDDPDRARRPRLALDPRQRLQPDRLRAPAARPARHRLPARAALGGHERALAGLARPCPVDGPDGPRLADAPARDRDPPGRIDRDPAGRQGRRQRRRSRILPPARLDPDPAPAADHGGRSPLRDRLHLHRHDRRLHRHPRRPGRLDPGTGELGLLPGDRGRQPRPGGGDRALPVPGPGRRRRDDAPPCPPHGDGL
ncbi:MAG: hypothetical protein AVDCRST_MAG59-3513, partial [uncultured Thermomicrobiales bacterium]